MRLQTRRGRQLPLVVVSGYPPEWPSGSLPFQFSDGFQSVATGAGTAASYSSSRIQLGGGGPEPDYHVHDGLPPQWQPAMSIQPWRTIATHDLVAVSFTGFEVLVALFVLLAWVYLRVHVRLPAEAVGSASARASRPSKAS